MRQEAGQRSEDRLRRPGVVQRMPGEYHCGGSLLIHILTPHCFMQLLLPASMRNPSSPARSPVLPSHTGNRGVAPQHTGTTTLARQFTGLGGSDAALLRQLTGGGLSPTRQLSSSPTKMFDGPRPGARYPRPKSVTGIRSTKSDGEGRGMFLVRQLTGGK